MKHASIRVAIADDHPALLIGIAHELSGTSAITVVGSAANSTELIAILDAHACDVLVTDYAMPGGEYGDGMALLSFVKRRFPQIQIVLFTMIENPGVFRALLAQDIHCILSKADAASHIVHAVRAAYSKGRYFSPTVDELIKQVESAQPRDVKALTRREAEIVRLYVSGLTVNQIAARMNRSKQTVSAQKRSAMRKLGIDREADLFKYALENGLVSFSNPARCGILSTQAENNDQ